MSRRRRGGGGFHFYNLYMLWRIWRYYSDRQERAQREQQRAVERAERAERMRVKDQLALESAARKRTIEEFTRVAPKVIKIYRTDKYGPILHRVHYDATDVTQTFAWAFKLQMTDRGIVCNTAQLVQMVGKASPFAQDIQVIVV